MRKFFKAASKALTNTADMIVYTTEAAKQTAKALNEYADIGYLHAHKWNLETRNTITSSNECADVGYTHALKWNIDTKKSIELTEADKKVLKDMRDYLRSVEDELFGDDDE